MVDILNIIKKIIITIFLIVILYCALANSQTVVDKIMNKVEQKDAKNFLTVENLIYYTFQIIIITFIGMFILLTWGISIGPLMASAGIAGLTLGFGAQSVVKDVINGFVIMLTNSINIGDKVMIGTTTGVVQNISLRSTTILSDTGDTVLIPNGDVDTITLLKK